MAKDAPFPVLAFLETEAVTWKQESAWSPTIGECAEMSKALSLKRIADSLTLIEMHIAAMRPPPPPPTDDERRL